MVTHDENPCLQEMPGEHALIMDFTSTTLLKNISRSGNNYGPEKKGVSVSKLGQRHFDSLGHLLVTGDCLSNALHEQVYSHYRDLHLFFGQNLLK